MEVALKGCVNGQEAERTGYKCRLYQRVLSCYQAEQQHYKSSQTSNHPHIHDKSIQADYEAMPFWRAIALVR
jgi:ribosomal protein S10